MRDLGHDLDPVASPDTGRDPETLSHHWVNHSLRPLLYIKGRKAAAFFVNCKKRRKKNHPKSQSFFLDSKGFNLY